MDYPVSISVIMATYNTEISMLKEAVDSILNQTFKDFDFINTGKCLCYILQIHTLDIEC